MPQFVSTVCHNLPLTRLTLFLITWRWFSFGAKFSLVLNSVTPTVMICLNWQLDICAVANFVVL